MLPLPHRRTQRMAADMQRKRSSECPDGTLTPSDGHSVERAESPTPGLAQGMEPGMGKCTASASCQSEQAPGGWGQKLAFPTTFCFPLIHAFVSHSLDICQVLGKRQEARLILHVAFLSTSYYAVRPELSGCHCGLFFCSLCLQHTSPAPSPLLTS